MIRSQRLPLNLLNAWLINQPVGEGNARYRLRVWRENRGGLAAIENQLIAYINEAFEDAKKRIRLGFEDNLSPFADSPRDPAENYPMLLHQITLQGYLGEILGALAVEHWGVHNQNDWVVPAFLFRYHNEEFQHLEGINQRLLAGEPYDPDSISERRPGRTGDDGLAFRINSQNTITDIIALESKCLTQNNTTKIAEAHQKLSAGLQLPSGVRELINLLDEYQNPQAQVWQEALLKLWQNDYRNANRFDGLAYVCGQIPVRPPERIAWLPVAPHHPDYTVARNLEGMEFQFEDLRAIVETLLRGG